MTYKKRAKADYNSGKEYKKESNRSERAYGREEIQVELDSLESDFKYKHVPSKKTLKMTLLEKKVIKKLKHNRWSKRLNTRYADIINKAVTFRPFKMSKLILKEKQVESLKDFIHFKMFKQEFPDYLEVIDEKEEK